jgi:hypothetical protein
MAIDFEGTSPSSNYDLLDTITSSNARFRPFEFVFLGTSNWFQFDSEPSEKERAAEDNARKIVAECNVRGIN